MKDTFAEDLLELNVLSSKSHSEDDKFFLRYDYHYGSNDCGLPVQDSETEPVKCDTWEEARQIALSKAEEVLFCQYVQGVVLIENKSYPFRTVSFSKKRP